MSTKTVQASNVSYLMNSVLNEMSMTNSFDPSTSNIIVEEGHEEKTGDQNQTSNSKKAQANLEAAGNSHSSNFYKK